MSWKIRLAGNEAPGSELPGRSGGRPEALADRDLIVAQRLLAAPAVKIQGAAEYPTRPQFYGEVPGRTDELRGDCRVGEGVAQR